MTEPRLQLLGPSRRRRRVRRWLALALIIVVGALTVTYQIITEPDRLRRICEARLRRVVDGAVRVEQARFNLFGGLELSGVGIASTRVEGETSGLPDPQHPDLYVSSLLVRYDPAALFLGRFVVQDLVLSDAVCHVIRDDSSGSYNLARLFRFPAQRRASPHGPLPRVHLRDAVLVFTRQNALGRREIERVGITAAALPDECDPSSYTIGWNTTGADRTSGRSRLTLDPITFTDLEGGLPWMSLETVMLGADSRVPSAGDWFTLLGLSGEIRAQDYSLSMGSGSDPARVTIRLRDAALSVPIDEEEQGLPAEERYLRFEHVQGEVQICGDIAEARFAAQFHDASCRVFASLTGDDSARANLGDVGFRVEMNCDELELPSDDPAVSAVEARFIRRWRPVRSFFNDFDPHGRVSIDIAASKSPGPEHHARLESGRITVKDADAAYRGFPYRVSGLRGQVDLEADGIHIRELTGEHDGAPIRIRGWVQEPRWQTAVSLSFGGQGVKLDAALHDALSPRFRRIWDQFDLFGVADLDVSMTRAGPTDGHPAPWKTTVQGNILDGRASFAGFPYPLTGLKGDVQVTPSRIEVRKLTGQNGNARVCVDGYAHLAESGPSEMDLKLDARGVSFDPDLIAALPEGSRQAVAAFSPRGDFDLSGRISYDPSARSVTYDLTAAIREASFRHRDLPAAVEGVSGDLRIQPSQVVIERLTGRRGPTRIGITGAVASAAGQTDARAVIRCEALTLDEELLAAMPEPAASVCRSLNLAGSLNTTTTYERRGPRGAESVTQRTVVEAQDVSMQAEAFPLPLTKVRGTLSVETGQIDIDKLTAACGAGRLALGGAITYGQDGVHAEVSLDADQIAFDEALRQAIPWRLRRLWNNVAPTGTFDLALDRLEYQRAPGDAPPRWDFAGRLGLADVGLDLGTKIGGVRGTVVGRGALLGSPAQLDLSADLSVDRMTLAGRPIEHLRGRAEASAPLGTIALRNLQADLCGGRATAEVRLFNDETSRHYEVAVTLQDVDLTTFINAGRGEDDPPRDASGRMDAHLYLGSAGGAEEGRRGGGRLLIREGQLYRLPLVSAIRGEARLQDADETASQELTVEFFLAGSRVELRDLVLQGRGLALIGAGEVAPRDGALDLTLVAVTPREWVKVPVLTEFLEGASRELVEISVRGTLAEPNIATRPLRSVEAALETLFQKRAARRTP